MVIMADVSYTQAGVTLRASDGSIRKSNLKLTAGHLSKSVVTTDGLTDRDTLGSTNSGHIFIDAIRSSTTDRVTIKMHKSAAKDVVTAVEAMTQFGNTYTKGVSDVILPDPHVFIGHDDSKYITFVSDIPCSIEITIMYDT